MVLALVRQASSKRRKQALRDFRYTLTNWNCIKSIASDEKASVKLAIKKSIYLNYYWAVVIDRAGNWATVVTTLPLGFVVFRLTFDWLISSNNFGLNPHEISEFFEHIIAGYGMTIPNIAIERANAAAQIAIVVGPPYALFHFNKRYGLLPSKYIFAIWIIFIFLWCVLGSIGLACYDKSQNLACSFVARCGILAPLSGVAIGSLIYTDWLARAFAMHERDRRYPDSELAMCMFDLLFQLEKPKIVWQDLEMRAYSSNLLERAAFIVRKYLFRSLRASDPSVQSWQDEKKRGIAAAFLEKQRWLMTPMPSTQDVLCSRTAAMLLATLKGEWDSFDIGTDQSTARATRGKFLASILRFLQKLLAAFSPLILLAGAKKYALVDLDSSFSSYLQLGAMLWAVVSLLYLLDPRPDEKISMIKNILTVTRSGDKKTAD